MVMMSCSDGRRWFLFLVLQAAAAELHPVAPTTMLLRTHLPSVLLTISQPQILSLSEQIVAKMDLSETKKTT